jgi:hypothetical protein
VAGFHIEYSGMKFGMFFVAEFLHAFTVGVLTAVLFLGGWRGPGAEAYPWLGVLYFTLKAFAGYFAVILLRAALPRIRIDHMLDLNWKFLVPVSLAAVVFTIVVDKTFQLYAPTDSEWARAGVLFLANLLLAWLTYYIISASARRLRRAEESAAEGGHDGGEQGGEHGAGHHSGEAEVFPAGGAPAPSH